MHDKILTQLPAAHVLHVVRNPWSAYADTKKRPVPLSLHNYMIGWTLNQFHARLFEKRFPGRVHIARIEDIMTDPLRTLGIICERVGLGPSESLKKPSWNGITLDEVYPWGTIRNVGPEANRATALELSAAEQELIGVYSEQYLEAFDYKSFLK